jgi:hypothetical protein
MVMSCHVMCMMLPAMLRSSPVLDSFTGSCRARARAYPRAGRLIRRRVHGALFYMICNDVPGTQSSGQGCVGSMQLKRRLQRNSDGWRTRVLNRHCEGNTFVAEVSLATMSANFGKVQFETKSGLLGGHTVLSTMRHADKDLATGSCTNLEAFHSARSSKPWCTVHPVRQAFVCPPLPHPAVDSNSLDYKQAGQAHPQNDDYFGVRDNLSCTGCNSRSQEVLRAGVHKHRRCPCPQR